MYTKSYYYDKNDSLLAKNKTGINICISLCILLFGLIIICSIVLDKDRNYIHIIIIQCIIYFLLLCFLYCFNKEYNNDDI